MQFVFPVPEYGMRVARACTGMMLVSLAVFAAPEAVTAQQPNVKAQCVNEDIRGDETIRACTALIRMAGATQADLVLAYHRRGIAHTHGNHQDQAIADYNAAIALEPANKEVLISRGNAYRAKNDRARALNDYQYVINLDPTFAKAFVGRAEIHLDHGRLEQSIADYTKAINLGLPWKQSAYRERGYVHQQAGNLEAAIADFSEDIRLSPGEVGRLFGLRDRGDAYLLNAQFDEAIKDYSEILAKASKDLRSGSFLGGILLGRGNAYRGKGQHDLALKDYAEALKFEAEAGKVALERGRTHAAKGDWQSAVAEYRQAIEIHGNHSTESSLIGRGNAHLALKEYDRAIEFYTRAAEGYSYQRALSLQMRADAFEVKGDTVAAKADRARVHEINPQLPVALNHLKKAAYDDTVALFSDAIRLRPNDMEMRFARGLANRYMAADGFYGRLYRNAAIADFSQVIRLNSKSAEAFGQRGSAYLAQGNYEDAASDLTTALRLDPDLRAALRARGQLYSDKRDFERAVADYSRLIALDAKDTDALMRRAVAYAGKKELDNTIADITKIIKLDPKNSNAFYQRAEAYLVKKDYRSAIADYSTAIALNPMLTGATFASLKKEQVSFGRGFSMMFYQRGSAYLETGDYHRAIVDFTDAIEVERDPLAIFFEGRAAAQQKLGMTEKAIVDYQSAASIFENAGNVRDAFRIFNLILEIKPDLPEGLNGRCWIRGLANEQLKEALEDCNASLAASRNAFTLDSRALVYYRLGDFKAALADYDEAIKLNAKTAAFWYGRSAVRAKLGDARGAREDIETATKLDANIGTYFAKFGL